MKIVKEVVSWVGSIFISVAVALAINIFVFQPTQVEGRSMEPTLHDSNRVFVNKLPHSFHYEPNYGDIVIIDSRVNRPRTFKDDLSDNLKYNLISRLISKNEDEIFWIKRVIGKAGDQVKFEDGKVYRNGVVLNEPYINEPMRNSTSWEVTVPEGHVFVMGDNRNNSSDSRIIGSVPLTHVVGKYVFKF